MIGVLLSRDMTFIARRRGLVAAAAAHAAIACGFMLAWSGERRVPVLPGTSLYEQLFLVQSAFLCIAAPWIAARLMADERRVSWVRLAALTGATPQAAIVARIITLSVWIAIAVAAAWPAALLAKEMSGVTSAGFFFDQVTLLGFGLLAGLVTLEVELIVDSRLASWLSATAISVLIYRVLWSIGSSAALLSLVVAIAVALRLAWRADQAFWYLPERR